MKPNSFLNGPEKICNRLIPAWKLSGGENNSQIAKISYFDKLIIDLSLGHWIAGL